MSELTLTLVRLGLLVLLWVFVFSVAGVLRSDLYGTRVSSQRDVRPRPRPRNGDTPVPTPARRRRGAGQLVVTEGSLRGTTLPLRGSAILIGRNPECALILDDDFASGRHARIYPDGDQWLVEDLGSTNGTYLNTERLDAPTPLTPGSELKIGRTIIEARR